MSLEIIRKLAMATGRDICKRIAAVKAMEDNAKVFRALFSMILCSFTIHYAGVCQLPIEALSVTCLLSPHLLLRLVSN